MSSLAALPAVDALNHIFSSFQGLMIYGGIFFGKFMAISVSDSS